MVIKNLVEGMHVYNLGFDFCVASISLWIRSRILLAMAVPSIFVAGMASGPVPNNSSLMAATEWLCLTGENVVVVVGW